MNRFLRFASISMMISVVWPGSAFADLAAYFKKPEPVYRWEKTGEDTVQGVKVYDLHLVSQTWQGIVWEHRLQVFRPEKLDHPEFCTIYNTGGKGSSTNTAMGVRLAKQMGMNYAILFGIPNQPLYGGKTEDALVVYTWLKYMETGDDSWPLHFPMAKAVLKSMDAIQEMSKKESLPEINSFLINGGSKRGWTTWLAGASRDPRIKAIAPMVIDTLNLPAQSQYQMEYYHGGSEQIEDYTKVDMFHKLLSPEGAKLIALEDPYSYRNILTLPKLLILGTNDRYWPQDALNLYWDGLKGPKWVLYTPNSGHGLDDRERVFNTLSAFARTIASNKPWPKMHWGFQSDSTGATLHLSSDVKLKEARLFHVTAKTKDFRDSKWTFGPMQADKQGFTAKYAAPTEGYAAVFGEAVYEIDGKPFTLSTQIRILSPAK